jgi:Fic family protein
MPTASLSVSTLCWLHRIVTEGLGYPEAVRGRFRAVQVWIGGAGSSRENANYVPPPPTEVLDVTSELLAKWRQRHIELRRTAKPEIVAGLADFHHSLLRIHPFLDGNGRVARLLLDQAARELLNQSIGREFTTSSADYFLTLVEADKGHLEPLQQRIMACLE